MRRPESFPANRQMVMSSPRARLVGYGLCSIAAMFWSGTSPLIGLLLKQYHITPVGLALWRDLFAAIALISIVMVTRPAFLGVPRRQFFSLALVGVFGIGLYHSHSQFSHRPHLRFWIWHTCIGSCRACISPGGVHARLFG